MRIIANSTLVAFGAANPRAATALAHWRRVVKEARWSSMADAQATFSKSKAINGERLRFEIAAGAFRLICAIDFGRQIVFIKFLGSHAEYDTIDAASVARF